MLRHSVSACVIATLVFGPVPVSFAQTRPAPLVPETKPAPLPETKPAPLPAPVPEGPTTKPSPGWERPVYPEYPTTKPSPPYPDSNGYAGEIRCESRNKQYTRCRVRTENHVIMTKRHSGDCRQGKEWGYDNRSIWVDDNCRATFAYGYGNYYAKRDKDTKDGPSTGAIVGGIAAAGILAAIIASQTKKKKQPEEAETTAPAPEPEAPASFPPGPPAAIVADLSSLTADQRRSMDVCLTEAARQVGTTGGKQVALSKISKIEQGNGGWRFTMDMIGSYPDGDHQLPAYCRATPTKVVQFDFTA